MSGLFNEELNCQASALQELSHGDNKLMLELIEYKESAIAIIFRDVINITEKNYGRVPTSAELIRIASSVLGINLKILF